MACLFRVFRGTSQRRGDLTEKFSDGTLIFKGFLRYNSSSAGIAQLVEQRYRKSQVVRSSRIAGSRKNKKKAFNHRGLKAFLYKLKFIVCPHTDNFDGLFFFYDLINKSVFNV